MPTDDDEIRITLRLPAPLRDRLKKAADSTNRSMNAEIISRLETYDGIVDEKFSSAAVSLGLSHDSQIRKLRDENERLKGLVDKSPKELIDVIDRMSETVVEQSRTMRMQVSVVTRVQSELQSLKYASYQSVTYSDLAYSLLSSHCDEKALESLFFDYPELKTTYHEMKERLAREGNR